MVYIYIMKNNQNTIKPGMNSESKARFFAQYMFQRVLMWHDQSILYAVDGSDLAIVSTKKTQYFLLLTPLSDITDEDAIECYKIHFKGHLKKDIRPDASRIEFAKRHIISPIEVCIPAVVDYLRSRGYALPFMGYSVDELIGAGWIKLKGGK